MDSTQKTRRRPYLNNGHFYLWVEVDSTLNNNPGIESAHPFHLRNHELIDFLSNTTKLLKSSGRFSQNEIIKLFLCLPSDGDQPFPSYELSRYLGIEIPTISKWQFWQIDTIELSEVISSLAEILFLHYHLPENVKLGQDLLFWCRYLQSFQHILRKDHYIPVIKSQANDSSTLEFHAGWDIVSAEYDEFIDYYSNHMPFVCAGGFKHCPDNPGIHDKKGLLKHFSENLLDNIVARTPFTQQLCKQMEGSLLAKCTYDHYVWPPETWEKIWNKWYNWYSQLTHRYVESEFNLCFRLVSADSRTPNDWSIEFLIESQKDPSFKLSLKNYWSATDEEEEKYVNYIGANFKQHLLLLLGQASKIYDLIESGLETHEPTHIKLSLTDAIRFIKEDAWILQEAGFKVVIPRWWTPKGRRQTYLRMRSKLNSTQQTSNVKSLSYSTLLSFEYQLAIRGEDVTHDEWQQLVDNKQELVYFRGQWVELDLTRMQETLEFWEKHQDQINELPLSEILRRSLEGINDVEFEVDENLSRLLGGLYDKTQFKLLAKPKGFNGKLRKYQKRGFSWLNYLENIGMSSCLADDMGLGKTIQVIVLLLSKQKIDQQATLIIAPTSVLGNWEKELQRFSPGLNIKIHHGFIREQDTETFLQEIKVYDVIITSYTLARKDISLFSALVWERIILDEAQNIKNPKSLQTKAISKLKANHRIALTGTPIENRLLDMWSIFNFLNPGYLGTISSFKARFEIPIQKNNDVQQSMLLKRLVEPFILRRLKTDKSIIKDLPDKLEQNVYCYLTKEQGSLYQAVVNDVENALHNADEGIQRKGIMLATLMKLKQICNHPRQFLQDNSPFLISRSHKLGRVKEMVEEVIENRESVLIFSQFTEICGCLEQLFKFEYHYNTYYLHGGTSRKKRERMISEFQQPETEPSIFILSLKAGGVGITLTKANHVFHFDRWWNPAVENQATDRAYRIGQNKTVFAHKFIAKGTFEERIDEMLVKKQKLADTIVGSGESWLTELNNEAFRELIQLNQYSIMD